MKLYNLILISSAIGLISLSACKKAEVYDPVSSGCTLPFDDSSASNPMDRAYQAVLDKYVAKGLPGLVVLISTPGKGLWIGASGYSGIEEKSSMQPCSIVYSASIGKTYCAVAIMKLKEEGKINIDDKISNYLPESICNNTPNGNTATVRDLLGQRSGIPNVDSDPQFIADVLNDPFSITTDDLIEYDDGKSALFNAGEGYAYSSTGYELLARVIDNVTGENHGKYYTSHIFQPLGLNDTYYKNEAGFPEPGGLVNCYFDRLGDGTLENVSDVNNYLTQVYTGSDGIMASAYDYYLFINALVKGGLVSEESYMQMTDWKDTKPGKTDKYGLGLMRRETPYGYKIGHDGDAMGAGADMFYFPEYDITIVTATNLGTFLDTDLSLIYNEELQDELIEVVFSTK